MNLVMIRNEICFVLLRFAIEMRKRLPSNNFYRIFFSLFCAFANFLETIFDGNMKREKSEKTFRQLFASEIRVAV